MRQTSFNCCFFLSYRVSRLELTKSKELYRPDVFSKSTNNWCSVASWVVEIYAWSTIWQFLDLMRPPQWPQIKVSKFKEVSAQFLFNFCLFLSFFLFWPYIYDEIYADTTAFLKSKHIIWFCHFQMGDPVRFNRRQTFSHAHMKSRNISIISEIIDLK